MWLSLLCLANMDHIKCFMLCEFIPFHVVLDMIVELIMGFFSDCRPIDSLVI